MSTNKTRANTKKKSSGLWKRIQHSKFWQWRGKLQTLRTVAVSLLLTCSHMAFLLHFVVKMTWECCICMDLFTKTQKLCSKNVTWAPKRHWCHYWCTMYWGDKRSWDTRGHVTLSPKGPHKPAAGPSSSRSHICFLDPVLFIVAYICTKIYFF